MEDEKEEGDLFDEGPPKRKRKPVNSMNRRDTKHANKFATKFSNNSRGGLYKKNEKPTSMLE